ncbi:unnamed protein product [Paramecium octaurelia]|uniref:Mini antigen n=1 Tax=Paramecium octaurelia TaxID=43137 RepID=A0A8S1V8X2_PAROT|nr:unnamed protein product [Paramecium octaurelia]
MKIYLIGFTLLVIANSVTLQLSSVYQCSCENLLQQADCLSDYCTWDPNGSTCTNKACSVFKENDCKGVPDPFNCVWNSKTSKCEDFTSCSDYSYKMVEGDLCYDLIKCQVDVDTIDSTAGTVKCTDRTQESALSIGSCDKVPYSECNWLVTSDGKQCVKNVSAQTCETKTITQCSDYTSIDVCNTNSCYWGDSCKPLTCSILPEDACMLFFSIDAKQVTFCNWDGTKCSDVDTTTLTQTQCLPYTLYSYAWNPDTKKCEICQEPSSSSKFILYGSILLAILLN